jgi:hypothetical protein
MTNCEYCDYCKTVSGKDLTENSERAFCLFADVMLFEDSGEQGAGYPCKDMSYQDYLERDKNHIKPSKVKNDNNWQLLYKSKHPVAEENRTKTRRVSAI